MDEIEFTIAISLSPMVADVRRVDVLINGRHLAELARDVEHPFAAAEGSPSIAGWYTGLSASAALPPSRLFLGEPSSRLYLNGERTDVLGCECGEPFCWPLVCRITVNANTVVWSDFLKPDRQADHPTGEWRYDGFGPFEFQRLQYEEALSDAASVAAALTRRYS